MDQRMGRELGCGLLTLANVIAVGAPIAADWNASHLFNERWPSHARFHAAATLVMSTALSGLAIGRLWVRPDDTSRLFAAAVPISYWAAFFPALLVPGTGVDDQEHRPLGDMALMACAGAVWQARFWWRLAGQHSWALILGEVLQQTVRPLVVRRCDRCWDVVPLGCCR